MEQTSVQNVLDKDKKGPSKQPISNKMFPQTARRPKSLILIAKKMPYKKQLAREQWKLISEMESKRRKGKREKTKKPKELSIIVLK